MTSMKISHANYTYEGDKEDCIKAGINYAKEMFDSGLPSVRLTLECNGESAKTKINRTDDLAIAEKRLSKTFIILNDKVIESKKKAMDHYGIQKTGKVLKIYNSEEVKVIRPKVYRDDLELFICFSGAKYSLLKSEKAEEIIDMVEKYHTHWMETNKAAFNTSYVIESPSKTAFVSIKRTDSIDELYKKVGDTIEKVITVDEDVILDEARTQKFNLDRMVWTVFQQKVRYIKTIEREEEDNRLCNLKHRVWDIVWEYVDEDDYKGMSNGVPMDPVRYERAISALKAEFPIDTGDTIGTYWSSNPRRFMPKELKKEIRK